MIVQKFVYQQGDRIIKTISSRRRWNMKELKFKIISLSAGLTFMFFMVKCICHFS